MAETIEANNAAEAAVYTFGVTLMEFAAKTGKLTNGDIPAIMSRVGELLTYMGDGKVIDCNAGVVTVIDADNDDNVDNLDKDTE